MLKENIGPLTVISRNSSGMFEFRFSSSRYKKPIIFKLLITKLINNGSKVVYYTDLKQRDLLKIRPIIAQFIQPNTF